MFIAHNQVRMHDTDMVGILYFAAQFRFAHDALEDFMAQLGFALPRLFVDSNFVFVIRHAAAEYLAPLAIGDPLRIAVSVTAIGTSSFTVDYAIYRHEQLVGKVETTHVTLDRIQRVKIPLPQALRAALELYSSSC